MTEKNLEQEVIFWSEEASIWKRRYEELLDRLEWLECLEEAGVDNWEGVSHAHELYEERSV